MIEIKTVSNEASRFSHQFIRTTRQSYSNQNSMVQALKQTHRSMVQNRE